MRVLIVGTLEGYITAAGKLAAERGAKVSHVAESAQALAHLRSGKGADLVLVDVRLDVAQLITALLRERFSLPVVACGIGQNKSLAVGAIKAGAKEYLPLPPDPELIAAVLEAVTNQASQILHSDPVMREVVSFADRIAPSDASVLITGESGTGKEVLANYLHQKSKRVKMPFVSLNCAAIPEALLESELFGHEKGAFTGAIARRIGKFEEAHGGTLMLDEVSEMDPRLQAKLLRAIQEREITRIGGNKPIKVDIRIFATTNRQLQQYVKEGSFREDLYFRLNVVNINLPPLRNRPGDIMLLSSHFIEKYSRANEMPIRRLSPEARKLLLGYAWPGNVRELENTIHRAVLLSGGEEISEQAVLLQAYPGEQPSTPGGQKDSHGQEAQDFSQRSLADVEKDTILQTLDHCLGNRTQTANILGISIRTLRNKLKQYSIDTQEDAGDHSMTALVSEKKKAMG